MLVIDIDMLFKKLDLKDSLNLHMKKVFQFHFIISNSLMYKRLYFLLICFIHMSPLKINRTVIYLLPLHKILQKFCFNEISIYVKNMMQCFSNYHFVSTTQEFLYLERKTKNNNTNNNFWNDSKFPRKLHNSIFTIFSFILLQNSKGFRFHFFTTLKWRWWDKHRVFLF